MSWWVCELISLWVDGVVSLWVCELTSLWVDKFVSWLALFCTTFCDTTTSCKLMVLVLSAKIESLVAFCPCNETLLDTKPIVRKWNNIINAKYDNSQALLHVAKLTFYRWTKQSSSEDVLYTKPFVWTNTIKRLMPYNPKANRQYVLMALRSCLVQNTTPTFCVW